MSRKITITDEDGIILEEWWTDETTTDICEVIGNHLAVYNSEEELDDANSQDEE